MDHIHLVILFLPVAIAVLRWNATTSSRVFPKGPPPIPILGNVLDLTSKELWLRAHEWAKKYGNMTYIHVLGQGVLFLNKAEVAFDLLDRRGAVYSSKPRLIMVGELSVNNFLRSNEAIDFELGVDVKTWYIHCILSAHLTSIDSHVGHISQIPFTTYNDAFRRRRKLMQSTLGPKSIPNYHPKMEVETKLFVQSLASNPADYLRHIRRYSGGLALSVVYGHQVVSNDDPYLLLAEECMDLLANQMASGPGIWPVDMVPVLRYIPTWFPGGSFKRKAAVWKARIKEFIEVPWKNAKANVQAGTISPSFCSSLLDREGISSQEEEDAMYTANSMYAASADTTISTISHLILAMIYYPEVFTKARREIEEVVGTTRLPTFSDRDSLPYGKRSFPIFQPR
ncbi:hypothetical protein CVT26_000618 [Gymnopilus dilepis]|uniref:Cytochrome P450 n=1 Tax=Gymnopilus dilepis TaxID=231916 RepID=A0A409Y2D7_9AGAR|nr:hypothetical protein CVT26_000618 [Gymnopilus dilepis]